MKMRALSLKLQSFTKPSLSHLYVWLAEVLAFNLLCHHIHSQRTEEKKHKKRKRKKSHEVEDMEATEGNFFVKQRES